MMTSFDYNYQNALRQAFVFSILFVCEESFVRDTNLHVGSQNTGVFLE